MSLNTVGGAVVTTVTVARVAAPLVLAEAALPLVAVVGVFCLCGVGLYMIHKDRKGWAGMKYEHRDGSKFQFGFGLE